MSMRRSARSRGASRPRRDQDTTRSSSRQEHSLSEYRTSEQHHHSSDPLEPIPSKSSLCINRPRTSRSFSGRTSGSEPRPETCVIVVKGLRLSYEDLLRSVRGSRSV